MRAPFQILVIPYRSSGNAREFAVLKRIDDASWQFVSGGGEDEETPVQAAEREVLEETGFESGTLLTALDSKSSIPKYCFAAAKSWGAEVFVVPEHCFAVNVGDSKLVLSKEHTDLHWLPYAEASELLEWDSNRTALWELNERLKLTT